MRGWRGRGSFYEDLELTERREGRRGRWTNLSHSETIARKGFVLLITLGIRDQCT
jgi:hypothetical protein